MTARLDRMVLTVLKDKHAGIVGPHTTAEHCFVALASNRYDLLPAAYDDPVVAWIRLDCEQRRKVCEWRGWPASFALVGV